MTMSTQLEKIRKIVKENKAYLEALEELDRTGKLRKVRYKERVNFTIDELILNEFRKYCEREGYKMSTIIEKLIEKELKRNEKD